MNFLSSNCYSYSTSNEVFGMAHYKDICLNGTFMGMCGEFTCHYRKYDSWDKVIAEGDCTEEYGLKLSPIQFFRMGKQIMEFCNREFGTKYNTEFETPAWVRPNFCDEQCNYHTNKEYIDWDFKVSFDKYKKYDWSNGAKVWQDAIVYYEWEMSTKGVTYGKHNKSYYIGLADGFNEYIQQGCRLPKQMSNSYNEHMMRHTEEKFGLRKKYTIQEFTTMLAKCCCNNDFNGFTEDQLKVIEGVSYSWVTKVSIGDCYFKSIKQQIESVADKDTTAKVRFALRKYLQEREDKEHWC